LPLQQNGKCVCADLGLSASDPQFSVFQELGSLGDKPRETLYFLTECVGWRRQSCGTMSNLEVHHREFRSHSGADSEENLITLCTACHAAVHHSTEFLSWGDNRSRSDCILSQWRKGNKL